ncbi:MAG: phosphate signaling complex protein PhoU [Oscillospiraceae bacterium]|jgi:phosphate transport system protein|nr:phosphate signaling complex protein PhoU [Oscillospiraceae bacterium]
MRARFDEQLALLNHNLIEMGALIERAIARATQALETRDLALAREIATSDAIVDEKEKEIEAQCLKLLLIQQPVARDLRQISTALKMITDLERIGDQAADIAELCQYLQADGAGGQTHIADMARLTTEMVNRSIDAFVRKDLPLAHAVIASDDRVDDLYLAIKRDLIARIQADADAAEDAFDRMQVAKYYERIGDHAVNIAEWVIFSLTGVHKDRQVL